MIKTVYVNAKCSDCCDIVLQNDKNEYIEEHVGYVPKNIGIGGGDYIELHIDNATGKIVDWVPITTLKGNE